MRKKVKSLRVFLYECSLRGMYCRFYVLSIIPKVVYECKNG